MNSFEQLIGIRYELGGASLRGADCWGLAPLAFRLLRGIELPLFNAGLAGRRHQGRGFVRELVERETAAGCWIPVTVLEAQLLDVVVLRKIEPMDHIALVSPDPKLLLTTNDNELGSVLEPWGRGTFWDESRIEGVWRYAGAGA